MFTFRIISDGPHRSEKFYLEMSKPRFIGGQFHFGGAWPGSQGNQAEPDTEDMPAIQFVPEDRRVAQTS